METFHRDTFRRSSLAVRESPYKQKMWIAAFYMVVFGGDFCTCIRSVSEKSLQTIKAKSGEESNSLTTVAGWLSSNATLENSTYTCGSFKVPCNYARSDAGQLEHQNRLPLLQYECDRNDLLISASLTKYLPDGSPIYRVQITNTCLDCSLANIHVTCGDWATQLLVNPDIFRRVGDNDCLVNGGNALLPQDIVYFEYSNSFPYPMSVKDVEPVCN